MPKVIATACTQNHRWAGFSIIYAIGDEAVAYMFYRCFLFVFLCFFLFFSVRKKYETINRSRERLNGFS